MKTLLVCGLGRCGTSLIMQMLHAGGFPTTGEWPGFEDTTSTAEMSIRARFFRGNQGKAIKVLDPHLNQPPGGLEYRAIWLDRDPAAQARSVVKFAEAMSPGVVLANRAHARGMEASLRRDRTPAMLAVSRLTSEILFLNFETILARPLLVAQQIEAFNPALMDTRKMARQVRARHPDCLPYFLETILLAEGPE